MMLELSSPIDLKHVDFRVQSVNKGGYATILAYKDARVDMHLLDSIVGPGNWQRKHVLVGTQLYCCVGIYNPEIKEWVWKMDVGTESNTEKEKGQASDAFKRACFNWGIGRNLYAFPRMSIKLEGNEVEDYQGKKRATFNFKIKDWSWKVAYNSDGDVTAFVAIDQNGKNRFTYKLSSDDKRTTINQEDKSKEAPKIKEIVEEAKDVPGIEDPKVKESPKKEKTPTEVVADTGKSKEGINIKNVEDRINGTSNIDELKSAWAEVCSWGFGKNEEAHKLKDAKKLEFTK